MSEVELSAKEKRAQAAEKRAQTLALKKRQSEVVDKYGQFAEVLPREWFNTQGEAVELVKSMHIDIMGKDDKGNARPFNDLKYFLFQAAQRKLNPFKKQIHAVYIWDSKLKAEKLVVITGIDGFRAIAQRSQRPLYAGTSEPVWEYDADKKLKRAKVHVYAYNPVNGDREIITTGVAWYDEYVKLVDVYSDGKKTGAKKPNSTWESRPKGMLAKCAEALALRAAFPDELGGLYVQEEVDRLKQDDDSDKTEEQTDAEREALIAEKVARFSQTQEAEVVHDKSE